MKQITNKTILKQGNNTYQPVEVDGVIYWVDKKGDFPYKPFIGAYIIEWADKSINLVNLSNSIPNSRRAISNRIIAQSTPKIEGIPVISLDSYVERLVQVIDHNLVTDREISIVTCGVIEGYNLNPNQYTKADIEKAIKLARNITDGKDIFSTEDISGCTEVCTYGWKNKLTDEQIFEEINSISLITVNNNWEVISHE
jgi:hypothetical protein